MIPRTRVIWMDGRFVKTAKAAVHVLSHALHYGSGVFEGIRVYETLNGPAAFRLSDHVDRLFRSAAAFQMRVPYSKTAVTRAILETVRRNGFRECYVRPIIFYGEGKMQMSPKDAALHFVIAAWPWGKYLGDRPALSVGVSRYLRFHPASIVPGAKISGFYAASVLARMEAEKKGLDECILLDHEGFVAEGPGENIFMVKRGRLVTPKSPSILPGFTRASVIAIARGLRIPVLERKVSLKEFINADEAFFAGTAVEIAAIGKVNGRRIGAGRTGPMTARLKETYLAAAHGKLLRYKKWVTPVR